MPKNDDYAMSRADADDLMGATLLPDEIRVLTLKKYLETHSTDDLVHLFSNFIGMANSVVANTREFIELFLQVECKMSDREAEKINLPTIFGAFNGAKLALPPSKGMCHGCAFRLGSAANQSPITTFDAADCRDDHAGFMCHETLDDAGEPTQKCVGYIRAVGSAK